MTSSYQHHATLVNYMYQSKHTVILTGAGMSTESGIPDFRSRSGWWKDIDPLTVATEEALHKNYDLFHEFYSARLKGLGDIKPHKGHFIIAKWEQDGLVQSVATQNVDGLHHEAGSQNVDQLHGSIHSFRCHDCGMKGVKQQFLEKESCSNCGGHFRPNVVLFGEALPDDAWDSALFHIQKADLVIVIGTSLQVYPVSQLPRMTSGKTAFINKEIGSEQSFFDVTIEGSAGEALSVIEQLLNS
ncbi:SIR2 family NAD-dependent protein deacylase [Litchfieldia alkalitelluris]|uniref:SIR2 family NAD-dependent protein deacylase n=1 Tax=Litchfieldia alkalitelluris TaxID=304268 RepID=UPI000997374D|nr:NAD-dependent deacylase [Litchfieldia alkalitelluris]